jgi:hypothetical protein
MYHCRCFQRLPLQCAVLAVRNHAGAQTPYLLEADALRIPIGWGGVFGAAKLPEVIYLDGLQIALERSRNGVANWQAILESKQQMQGLGALKLELSNAQIDYTDHSQDTRYRVSQIGGFVQVNQAGLIADVRAQFLQQSAALKANCAVAQFQHLAQFDTSCKLNASGDGLSVEAQYQLTMREGALTARGGGSMTAQHMLPWADALFGQTAKRLHGSDAAPLPLSMTYESFADAQRLIVNVSALELGSSKGKGSLSLQQDENAPPQQSISLRAQFESLAMEDMAPLSPWFQISARESASTGALLHESISGQMQISAANVRYHGVTASNVSAQASVTRGQISITQAAGRLTDGGQFLTSGRMVSVTNGLQYEGLVEASGSDFSGLMPLMDASPTSSLKDAFTQFRLRMNAIVNPAQTVLSDLRLLVGNNQRFSGGLTVARADPALSIMGNLLIENVDTQGFWREWLGGADLFTPPEARPNHPLLFGWLEKLPFDAQFSLQLNNITAPTAEPLSGKVTLALQQGQGAIKDAALQLGERRAQGDITIRREAANPRPILAGKLALSQLDIENWVRESLWAREDGSMVSATNSVWSQSAFDFTPLKIFEGDVELSIGTLQHAAFTAKDVAMRAQLSNAVLRITPWRFTLWDSPSTLSVTLDASGLPRFEMQLHQERADIRQVMQRFFAIDAVNGQVALATNITTSGVNFYEWISNATGVMKQEAQQVGITGFNLTRLLQLLQSARSASELPIIMRQTTEGGMTQLQRLQSTLYVEQGRIRTTAFQLMAAGMSGTAITEVDLHRWQLQTAFRLGLAALSSAQPPVLAITFTGAFEDQQRAFELQALEAFLAGQRR